MRIETTTLLSGDTVVITKPNFRIRRYTQNDLEEMLVQGGIRTFLENVIEVATKRAKECQRRGMSENAAHWKSIATQFKLMNKTPRPTKPSVQNPR